MNQFFGEIIRIDYGYGHRYLGGRIVAGVGTHLTSSHEVGHDLVRSSLKDDRAGVKGAVPAINQGGNVVGTAKQRIVLHGNAIRTARIGGRPLPKNLMVEIHNLGRLNGKS